MFKILIVDDDRDFSKAVETYLSRNGYDAQKGTYGVYYYTHQLFSSPFLQSNTALYPSPCTV